MICCLRCIIIRYLWIINCSDPFWLFSENLGVIVVLNGIWPKVFLVNPTGHNRVSSKIIRVIASAHQIHDPRLIPQTGNQLMTNATFHIGPRTVGLCHTVELVRIWGQRKKGRQGCRCWGCWALRHSVSIGVFYKLPEKKHRIIEYEKKQIIWQCAQDPYHRQPLRPFFRWPQIITSFTVWQRPFVILSSL